jgi:hypothetical protein
MLPLLPIWWHSVGHLMGHTCFSRMWHPVLSRSGNSTPPGGEETITRELTREGRKPREVFAVLLLYQVVSLPPDWYGLLLLIVMIRLAPEGIWILLRQGVQRLAQMTIARQPSPLTEEGKDI